MKSSELILKERQEKTRALMTLLKTYLNQHGISKKQFAVKLGVSLKTLEPWFCSKKSGYLPGKKNLDNIENFLKIKRPISPVEKTLLEEAFRRVEKIKYILLLLEDELRWFKDSSQQGRDVLRKKLYPKDVSYISSLLTMLAEEETFKRWQQFTSYRFGFFKRK